MTIYELCEEPIFPSPEEAEPDGLLAVGGDLAPERLLAAYSQGIFPWYSAETPILWWSTDPRLILDPAAFHVPKRLARLLAGEPFVLTMDTAFGAVIRACAETDRPGQLGTWLVPEMIAAYKALHTLGYAHSVEAWQEGELVGGLYGVSLGRAFFGESMFYRVSEASKAALVHLASRLAEWGFDLLDCQQTTAHMVRFGAREMDRREFLRRLEAALAHPSRRGPWGGEAVGEWAETRIRPR